MGQERRLRQETSPKAWLPSSLEYEVQQKPLERPRFNKVEGDCKLQKGALWPLQMALYVLQLHRLNMHTK